MQRIGLDDLLWWYLKGKSRLGKEDVSFCVVKKASKHFVHLFCYICFERAMLWRRAVTPLFKPEGTKHWNVTRQAPYWCFIHAAGIHLEERFAVMQNVISCAQQFRVELVGLYHSHSNSSSSDILAELSMHRERSLITAVSLTWHVSANRFI